MLNASGDRCYSYVGFARYTADEYAKKQCQSAEETKKNRRDVNQLLFVSVNSVFVSSCRVGYDRQTFCLQLRRSFENDAEECHTASKEINVSTP